MKRVSLELGGHAPFIICDDADVPAAVLQVMASKFRNAGQTCVCANRVYVHEKVKTSFAEQMTDAVRALRVGDPMNDATQVGPLVDRQGLDKVAAHVDDDLNRPNGVLAATKRDGLFSSRRCSLASRRACAFEEKPSGLSGRSSGSPTNPDRPRRQRDAMDLRLRLDAGSRARVSNRRAAEYGIVGVNGTARWRMPFGGVKPGIGREGGPWGLDEFLDVKYISIALP